MPSRRAVISHTHSIERRVMVRLLCAPKAIVGQEERERMLGRTEDKQEQVEVEEEAQEMEWCKCGKPEEGDRTSLEEFFRLSTPFPSADLGEPAAGDTLFFRANKR
ncbi:hypothetical protein Baya_10759 [Bagarius yarrelli]|uniref:Uncharacterized protein n=1 Tax=Bagarius yarrelli TaxID=175774 RepID=A0A556UGD9_BAGYA|nr:hypothetical protein Baya_10759 [Bagarius yarrelli]